MQNGGQEEKFENDYTSDEDELAKLDKLSETKNYDFIDSDGYIYKLPFI